MKFLKSLFKNSEPEKKSIENPMSAKEICKITQDTIEKKKQEKLDKILRTIRYCASENGKKSHIITNLQRYWGYQVVGAKKYHIINDDSLLFSEYEKEELEKLGYKVTIEDKEELFTQEEIILAEHKAEHTNVIEIKKYPETIKYKVITIEWCCGE